MTTPADRTTALTRFALDPDLLDGWVADQRAAFVERTRQQLRRDAEIIAGEQRRALLAQQMPGGVAIDGALLDRWVATWTGGADDQEVAARGPWLGFGNAWQALALAALLTASNVLSRLDTGDQVDVVACIGDLHRLSERATAARTTGRQREAMSRGRRKGANARRAAAERLRAEVLAVAETVLREDRMPRRLASRALWAMLTRVRLVERRTAAGRTDPVPDVESIAKTLRKAFSTDDVAAFAAAQPVDVGNSAAPGLIDQNIAARPAIALAPPIDTRDVNIRA